MNIGKKVALHNLGCKVNSYETDAMSELLNKNGYEIVPFKPGADIYIINTCTVTNIADRKSRQMLHKARKMNKDAIVVAVGCYVQTAGEEAVKDEAIDIVIGNNKKSDIVNILEEYYRNKEARVEDKATIIDISSTKEYDSMMITGTIREHNRVFMKIQDGCNQFCSYCIIPFARGRVRSRKPLDILNEVNEVIKNDATEIVLTGIHLSSYGTDIEDETTSLIDIVERIAKIPGVHRIRLGSLEPNIISEEFMQRVAVIDKFCPQFHLSLQSGSDTVLKRMNRHYTADVYYNKCELIRKYYADAAITTDIIVGFPGETDAEFKETCDFAKKVAFSKVHVFKYSRRKGTNADKMKDQVPDFVKQERSERLIKVTDELQMEFMNKFIGKKVSVLWEEIVDYEGEKYITGYTKEYVRVMAVVDDLDFDKYINKVSELFITKILNSEILLAQF